MTLYRSPHRKHSRERGVVLLFTLVVLVVLLAGGVAVMRSMNASLASAGNIAFKRDLVNQGEQAVPIVFARFKEDGALESPTVSAANLKTANYSASVLPTNARGIPVALLNDEVFDTVGVATNDIQNEDAKVSIRYVIDRLCNESAAASTLGAAGCVYPPASTDVRGGSSQEMGTRPPPAPSLTYRLSMRVTGPRDTQVFLQASFARPD